MISRLPITYFLATQSFWNFAQNTVVILPCSVQHRRTIRLQKRFERISYIAQGSRWAISIAFCPYVCHDMETFLPLTVPLWSECTGHRWISHEWKPMKIFDDVLLARTGCWIHTRCRWFMMTSSNGNISALLALCVGNSPVSGEYPAHRPVTRSFDVFFDLRLDGRLSKHSWGWWLETPTCPLWRQSNVQTAWPACYVTVMVISNLIVTVYFKAPLTIRKRLIVFYAYSERMILDQLAFNIA